VLDHRFEHLVREVEHRDGVSRVAWRFDPLHRTTAPTPFFAKLFVEFAKRVTCPVLFVSGGATGFHVADEDERVHAFQHVRRAVLEDAGHMMHWTRPTELAALLVDFLGA
ncbi:MAG TPA: alpha/beta hydrolase, partial [Labilithrix sp.]|nr:alpha/beta hydrolase [Labilithrix sp.]